MKRGPEARSIASRDITLKFTIRISQGSTCSGVERPVVARRIPGAKVTFRILDTRVCRTTRNTRKMWGEGAGGIDQLKLTHP